MLFPAPAGVIPVKEFSDALGYAVPRTRGGDPRQNKPRIIFASCSPHPRG